ncbi:DNA adenine methylase [Acinetobacter dispersus]|uniref:DNA adenine methylase n=1 Tax=Acinetobacter dispersus TaxID=70348 RepID=UPI00132EEF69|nr:Dam family site-specific DNA-(adenine-N6)-methyltransferase [Acinetobacter dispersus]QHH99240.1 DNA adenine methylase [Acinetobacter dispersus]
MSAAKVNNTNEHQVSYNASGRSFSGWLGGKSQLARTIIELMPVHKYYCEVFGGAGWVLFKKTPSYGETINDINGDLINLYRVFKYHHEALVKEFETQLISRDEFLRARSEEPKSLTDIQRAARFYYMLRNCYGARIHNPSFCSHPIRPANLKLGDDLKEFLQKIHERLQRVTIENMAFDQLILQKDHKDMLFYLDPPYYQCEKYYGKDIFSRDDFFKLRDILKSIKGKFILSLNDVPQVREIFADFNFIEKKIRWSVNAKADNDELGHELIITNFNPQLESD